jgi:sugar lactone lactonase YvrE
MVHCAASIQASSLEVRLLRSATALLAFAAASSAGLFAAEARQIGDIETFAAFPEDPGFPEGIAVDGNRVYVSGAATFGTAGKGPSKILVYHKPSGALAQTIVVAGEALALEHAVTAVATDGAGRVYTLSTQLGLLRFTRHGKGYTQEIYGAPLPDLPACGAAPPGVDCAPTQDDLPPLVNDVVFDEDGFAYVTDSFQATVFRYAPGGGAPEVWFQSALLSGGGPLPFGVNGIRFDPEREHAYLSVTSPSSDPGHGLIYRLPLVEAPDEADLEVVHDYTAGEGPDGMAFGASGRLYVALASSNQISVLAPDGSEETRIQSVAGADVPLDAPANIAFDNHSKSLLVVNHAFLSGDAEHFAVLKVFVGDRADPLDEP